MPIRIEVRSPVVATTAATPISSANACEGGSPSVSGIKIASAADPPSPGRIPTTAPTTIPTANSPHSGQENTCTSPVRHACPTSSTDTTEGTQLKSDSQLSGADQPEDRAARTDDG